MTLAPESAGSAPSRDRLLGRRILVVGAGSRPSPDPAVTVGNGRAIAVLCAREGADVVCVDVNEDAAQHTAELCTAEGATATAVIADVRDARACERLVNDAHQQLGGLDGVVCNVGYGEGQGLAGTSPELWDDIFSVNIRSHFLVARAAMPVLDDGGAFVFIGSSAGIKAGTRLPAYDSSKAALFGLTRHVALEGAHRNIRANYVVPGPVDTPLGRVGDTTVATRTKIRWPLGRQATPWDVAYATAFMLSNEAAYITAQALPVDGGLTQFG